MDHAVELRKFVEYSIGNLIDHPEAAGIQIDDRDPKLIRFKVILSSDDVGKVIGRNGRTVSALRSLIEAYETKTGVKVSLKVIARGEED